MDIFWRVVIGVVALGTLFFLYQTQGDVVRQWLYSGDTQRIYVNQVAFSVTIADTPEERKRGLSGTAPLGQYEGKLFIFDSPAQYGIWMKDMNYAIDVLWFSADRELVYIEENMSPDSYPKVYAPDMNALYVLEIPAHSVRSLNLKLGDQLLLPSAATPVGQ